MGIQTLQSLFKSSSASALFGRAGMAPFLVVVMAPHALANLRTPLSFSSL